MNGLVDRRLVADVLLAGALLALVGNGLHPILDPATDGTAGLLAAAGSTSSWVALHLGVALAALLLTAGTVLLMRGFAGTAGEPIARLATALALVGGTIFVVGLGGVDGVVMPVLAEQLAAADDRATVLAVAEAMAAFDLALIALSTIVYFGGMFVAVGLTLQRTATFAPWLRWTALSSGTAGVVVGVLLFLDVAMALAFSAFRLIALAETIVAVGLAVALRRDAASAPAAAAPPSAAPA